MEKLKVKICTGTVCYVMGGAELQLIEEYLPEELLDKVDIKGSPCLEHCNREEKNCPKAPFVQVGDQLIAEASITKVVEIIKKELNK